MWSHVQLDWSVSLYERAIRCVKDTDILNCASNAIDGSMYQIHVHPSPNWLAHAENKAAVLAGVHWEEACDILFRMSSKWVVNQELPIE
jgi:hypothetical protein